MPIASLSDIWSAAAERLAWLHNIFGAPFAFLAQREDLTRAARQEILAYLRPLERLIRCALILAALTAAPSQPKRAPRAARRPMAPRAPHWPGEDSRAWRGVRFTVLPRAALPHARARSAGAVFSRYAIAKRMEAVARILDAPARWVARLAATIRLRRNTVLPACRRATSPSRDASEDIVAAASLAAAALHNTS
ncbi:MAG: hypothetical protein GC206_14545 [Alphaproteobacteria bacterium]|nr:hypothetical protein [Alphaproteobacteria bacterium]